MGIFDLGLLWLLVWILKNAAMDVMCAAKGTPNPRFELKKQRAKLVGQAAPAQPRYGSRDWFADLWSDGLAANTERRRAKVTAKAQPVDDMVELVREPKPARDQVSDEPTSVVHDDQHPYCLKQCGPRCVKHRWKCDRCGKGAGGFGSHVEAEGAFRTHACQPDRKNVETKPQTTVKVSPKPMPVWGLKSAASSGNKRPSAEAEIPDEMVATALQALVEADPKADRRLAHMDRVWDEIEKTYPNASPELIGLAVLRAERLQEAQLFGGTGGATILQFSSIKNVEKEITMANSEITGLSTAIAFAEAAAGAHSSFATGGTEGYVGALERANVGADCVGLAKEAQEASSIAAEKWQAHAESLSEQLNVREAYQSNPDAGDKDFVVNE